MAQDDMEIVMYKILSYLYRCMKDGKRPKAEDMCCECQMFHISASYWGKIMDELILNEYIRGFNRIPTKGATIIQMRDDAGITYKGREFLIENAGMKRAAAFLGGAFSVILDGIVGAII